jgi:hypothetical protein
VYTTSISLDVSLAVALDPPLMADLDRLQVFKSPLSCCRGHPLGSRHAWYQLPEWDAHSVCSAKYRDTR